MVIKFKMHVNIYFVKKLKHMYFFIYIYILKKWFFCIFEKFDHTQHAKIYIFNYLLYIFFVFL